LRDMFLADDFGETLGPVLARYDLIRHRTESLNDAAACSRALKRKLGRRFGVRSGMLEHGNYDVEFT
jgi:hypothetical protein